MEIPMLAAIQANDRGVFELLLLRWDHQPLPSPIELKWQGGNVRPGQRNLSSMAQAFQYAVEHTPRSSHTGTVSTIGLAYASTGTDGPSAGAVMAVGFAALLKGDHVQRGIALTGTIDKDGRIGSVGGIPDKVRAAAREGYRTVLIPEDQLTDPRWNLTRLGWELNVEIREVGTIEQAYQLMTGNALY
ncbi:MAG TPA: S16 family serine protease [Nitrospiraceae bacterium]|nr:S16 family serine protease [Nitrospiraceae bacterium]